MNFSKIEGFFQFSGLLLQLGPILPEAFEKVENFTRKMNYWIFFGAFGACCTINKQTSQKRGDRKTMKTSNIHRERHYDSLGLKICKSLYLLVYRIRLQIFSQFEKHVLQIWNY